MADKSLGQHWLFDKNALQSVVKAAEIGPGETVLEIGPGLGTLTHELINAGAKVIAVEFDRNLIPDLLDRFPSKDLTLLEGDILRFDFGILPKGYKVVANIPYYLTSHLLRLLCETTNRPEVASLLVQKEVAERVTADPGAHTILSVSVQLYANASLGDIVPAALFAPPPKVDSQVLILKFYDQPLVTDPEKFMKLVKAGFSAPRKKLRSSLAGGLHVDVHEADSLLLASDIDPDRRPQTLSHDEWAKLLAATAPLL